MRQETRNFSQIVAAKGSQMVDTVRFGGVMVGLLAINSVGWIYAGVRGRFDGNFRQGMVERMMDCTYGSGNDYSNDWALYLWSRKDRRWAREQVKDTLRMRQERDVRLDAMSNEEMAEYAGRGVAMFLDVVVEPKTYLN